MRQYTDVRLTFTVEGLDLTTIEQPHMTFLQEFGKVFDTENVEIISEDTGSVLITQEQTALLKPGEVKVQLNFFNEYGLREASDEGAIIVESNLLRRILERNGN